jgi:hypothetical protein
VCLVRGFEAHKRSSNRTTSHIGSWTLLSSRGKTATLTTRHRIYLIQLQRPVPIKRHTKTFPSPPVRSCPLCNCSSAVRRPVSWCPVRRLHGSTVVHQDNLFGPVSAQCLLCIPRSASHLSGSKKWNRLALNGNCD